MHTRSALSLVAGLLAISLSGSVGCSVDGPVAGRPMAYSRATSDASAPIAASPQGRESAAAPAPSSSAPSRELAERQRFTQLVTQLSEPSAYFFSNNLISNETSYLQIADELAERASPEAAYVGVGPEQNFSYIALARPTVAFVVDIRRDNQLLLLLHRAAFERASSRAHYLALLLGRAHEAGSNEAPGARVDAVIEAALAGRADEASFEAAHATLRASIDGYDLGLSASDAETLRKQHRAFYEAQLSLRFELHHKNGRLYPTFGEMLRTRSPSGRHGSYLDTLEGFLVVQDLQRRGRIVPLVGDFAGDGALRELGLHLRSEGVEVGTFYVSNVEQYLLDRDKWTRWLRNVEALPQRKDAVFVRAYLDQGARHPAQLPGHRTATVLVPMSELGARFGKRPAPSLLALATEGIAAPRPR
jgi:hypothetical protein